MHYSMRYSLPRSYFLGGEPFVNLITNRWEMLESGVDTGIVLVDSAGSNNLDPTLGQGLSFDGVNDSAVAAYAIGDLVDGQTSPLTFAAILKAGGTFSTARCPIYGAGHISLGPFLALTSAMQPQVYFYYTHTVSKNVQAIATATSLVLTADTPYFVMAAIGPIVGSTNCSVDFTRVNLLTGAVTTQKVSLTLAGNFVQFKKTGSSPNDALHLMCATGTAAYMTGTVFSATVGFASPNYTNVLAILKDSSTPPTAIEEVMGTRCFCHYADGGSGSTITEATGNTYGHSADLTIGADYATMWTNGANESGFPQKGLGGGNYEGGIGIRMLYQPTGISSATSQPPAARSESQMSTMGNTFTFECWLYKDSAATTGYAIFASTTDQSVAVSADRVGFDIRSDASGRGFTFGAAGSSAITLLTNPGVVKNAAGWYYCALVVDSGSCTMYIAGTADSSFGTVHPAQNVGSMNSDGASGDQDLVIGGRKRGTGLYDYQLDQGCGVNDVVYFEGVALSESDLLKRFNYTKPKYL